MELKSLSLQSHKSNLKLLTRITKKLSYTQPRRRPGSLDSYYFDSYGGIDNEYALNFDSLDTAIPPDTVLGSTMNFDPLLSLDDPLLSLNTHFT